MFLVLSEDEVEVALDIGEDIEGTQGTAHIEVAAGEPSSVNPYTTFWYQIRGRGRGFWAASKTILLCFESVMWQDPFEPTTLDGCPLTIVLFFIEAIFSLLYNTTKKSPSMTYHNTSLARSAIT